MLQPRELFHTPEQYETRGFDPYREHASQYLAGKRTIPVSSTSSIDHSRIFFTFSNALLERIVKGTQMKKPYEVAIKYGFRGYSRGGKNGIFYQREGDESLEEKTDIAATEHLQEICEDLDITPEQVPFLRKVKIVWHNEQGNRIVGLYNTENHRMVFLDTASY